MRALTVVQPWACLIACGAKRYETRSWRTAYRGPLAIHASAGLPRASRAVAEGMFAPLLARAGWPSAAALPRGGVIAVATLADCVPTSAIAARLTPLELACGDYAPGRWAWRLEGVRLLSVPVPARGRLGLWPWGGEAGT